MAETLALQRREFHYLSMASDDELKDEELVDFEGSDYELDCDYEELEEIEEEEEEEEEEDAGQQQASDLVQGELHGQSDAKTLQKGSNEASETLESSAFLVSDNLKITGGSKSVSTCGASETLTDAGKAASACAEALEAPNRGSSGASATPEFHETLVSTTPGSMDVITSLPKASETSCSMEAVNSQSASKESSRMQQLLNKKEGRESGGIEGARDEKDKKSSPGPAPSGRESGEIEGARDEKDKKTIPGPAPSLLLDGSDTHCTLDSGEDRVVKLSKPDLEDGELDESAVLQNYGFEEEAKDETAEREKKRRKEGFATERQVDATESNGAKQLEETGDSTAKQHHSSGSDKAMEQFAGLSSAGGRGVGFRMIGLGQGSLAPGIMGPGRPFMHLGIGSLAQGFGPFGVIAPNGRPQVHLQEVLAQEHLFRAHALQLAQETLASAIRSPLARPLGAASFQPFLGFDVLGPRSHVPKHFPRPPHDLMLGHMGNFARGQRPGLAAGRGVSGKVGGQAEPTFNNGIGRQFGWSAASGPNEMQPLKRGRGRGSGLRTGSWGDAELFGPVPGGLGSAGNPRAMMNVDPTSNMRHMNPDEAIFYQTTLAGPQDLAHNGFDARWKIEKERMLRNGLPHFRMPENAMIGGNFPDSSMGLGKDPGKFGEGKSLRSQDSSRSGSLAARLGPPAQAKVATLITTDSGDLAAGSNVIKLLQPVRKSRILTVSGLPEDTPMSTVAEVFEKLGKITDFKKSSKGDTFTISYSNETEAVTAKRNLHRSCLAGKQITVDYAHQ